MIVCSLAERPSDCAPARSRAGINDLLLGCGKQTEEPSTVAIRVGLFELTPAKALTRSTYCCDQSNTVVGKRPGAPCIGGIVGPN